MPFPTTKTVTTSVAPNTDGSEVTSEQLIAALRGELSRRQASSPCKPGDAVQITDERLLSQYGFVSPYAVVEYFVPGERVVHVLVHDQNGTESPHRLAENQFVAVA